MATPPSYADVSVSIRHTTSSRPSYITFGVYAGELDGFAVSTSVLNALSATSGIKTRLDSSASFDRIRVSVGDASGEDLVEERAIAIVGGQSVNTAPPNCAVLVHKRTTRGGRRGRGRFFLPWSISASNIQENGMITAGEVVSLQSAMDNFLTQLDTGGTPMRLLHQPGGTEEGGPNVVTALVVDPMISTQRRRLGR
jgi:hypothetical protein